MTQYASPSHGLTSILSPLTTYRASKHLKNIPHAYSTGNPELSPERDMHTHCPTQQHTSAGHMLSATRASHILKKLDDTSSPLKTRDPICIPHLQNTLPSFQEFLANNGLEIEDVPPPNTQFCPLSVLELPTATYSWSPLLLASQMVDPPCLYVNYHNAQPLQHHHHLSNKSMRQSSPYTHQPQTSDRTVHREDIISGCQDASRRHAQNSLVVRSTSIDVGRGYRGEVALPVQYRSYHDPPFSRAPSMSHSEISSISDDESIPTNLHLPPPVAGLWEDYTEEVQQEDGSTAYLCLWELKRGGQDTVCNYISKKQLVKRHVETTHLKMKPFICKTCYKAFPQKSALKVHISGHTGEKPHKCRYECGLWFKDPARRHRHHVNIHGYVPKQSKRHYRAPWYNAQEDMK